MFSCFRLWRFWFWLHPNLDLAINNNRPSAVSIMDTSRSANDCRILWWYAFVSYHQQSTEQFPPRHMIHTVNTFPYIFYVKRIIGQPIYRIFLFKKNSNHVVRSSGKTSAKSSHSVQIYYTVTLISDQNKPKNWLLFNLHIAKLAIL